MLETSSVVLATSREAGSGACPLGRRFWPPLSPGTWPGTWVDITQVQGTGPAGRVMKEDIHKAAGLLGGKREDDPSPAAVSSSAASNGAVPALEERVPLTQLGKAAARTMSLSKQEIPHAAVMDEFDVTELVRFRSEAKELAEGQGAKLTYMAFIIKAAVLALQEFPVFNAGFDASAQEIVVKKQYNIGIAVDTADGLLVPVIKNADGLGILPLARQVAVLAEKAKARTLTLDEIQGGTFTLTNYGAVGALSGLPVIKHPEARSSASAPSRKTWSVKMMPS